MASIYDLKPKFQAMLRPLCRTLAKVGVTANQVTLAATAISIGTGIVIYWFAQNRLVLLSLPVVLFVRMALNAIDGMLAREFDMKSELGAILNELGDVVSDSALYLALAFTPFFDPLLIVAVVLLAVLSEMTGVVAVQIGASRRYDGPMGKSDRAFVFGTLGLLIGLGVPHHPWLCYLLIAMVALLLVTIIRRARLALSELKQ